MGQSAGQGAARAFAAIATLRGVADLLTPLGIGVMPLKGVALQAIDLEAFPRPAGDVDVLVEPGRYADALAALVAAGGWTSEADRHESARALGGFGLLVDVHQRLFAPRLFHLPAAEVWARGRDDREAFGVPVRLPSHLDLYAHVLGHFAKGRLGTAAMPRRRELGVLATRVGLRPRDVAKHLASAGLRRAAAYVLPLDPSDAFGMRVVEALRITPADRVAAWAASSLVGVDGQRRVHTALVPHLLNESARRGLASGLDHLQAGVRQRLRVAFAGVRPRR